MVKNNSVPAIPPGTEAVFSVTCKDVVMGRGSGTQNHCGNVTYRKLVYLNKELYATSSKFDKLKISKAIVGAVREFGGHFVQADEKRGGLYYDIGDKRAWDKTSQALREGQAEIRARLAEEDPAGMDKIAEYKQVISGQTFFAYACQMLESLYHPTDGQDTGITACGQLCPHAKRRQTLNQLNVDPLRIHSAMQNLSPPPIFQQQQQGYCQPTQAYSGGPVGSYSTTPSAGNPGFVERSNTYGSLNPLPFDSSVSGSAVGPYAYEIANQLNSNSMTSVGPYLTSDGTSAPTYNSYPSSSSYQSSHASTQMPVQPNYQGNMDPIPFNSNNGLPQRPGLMVTRQTTGGSVFSLRQFCSEDFEMTSSAGQMLMEQLNDEVDDLIRRKSAGLIKIDTTDAFQDLVFEEDSMESHDLKPAAVENVIASPLPVLKEPAHKERKDSESTLSPKSKENRDSSSTSAGRSAMDFSSGNVSMGTLRSTFSNNSGILNIDDGGSLMNMSILTLDDREGSGKDNEGATPKSILNDNTSSRSKDSAKKRRESRVSFARGSNMSLMSMDERSFSKLVDCISDPDGEERKRSSGLSNESGLSVDSSDSHSVSRKMGFPVRKTVIKKMMLEAGHEDGGAERQMSSMTVTECGPAISSLTITEGEEAILRSERDFSELAGEVESPGEVINSLNGKPVNLSKMSLLGVSAMSLGDIELDSDEDSP